jgi:glycerol kinase
MEDFAASWALERRFEPQMDEQTRRHKLAGWQDAVRRTLTQN